MGCPKDHGAPSPVKRIQKQHFEWCLHNVNTYVEEMQSREKKEQADRAAATSTSVPESYNANRDLTSSQVLLRIQRSTLMLHCFLCMFHQLPDVPVEIQVTIASVNNKTNGGGTDRTRTASHME